MKAPVHVAEWHRLPPVTSRATRPGQRVFACSLSVRVNDEWLTTSPIVKVDGNTVTTRSGSVYVLDGDVAGILANPPFYLHGGDAYPPGATVAPVPPGASAPLAEVHAFYGDRKFVVVYPEGDHEVTGKRDPEGAKSYARTRKGVLYLDGKVVE